MHVYTPAIEMQNIFKTFTIRSWRQILLRRNYKEINALKGVSCTVDRGEIVSLLGLNGAGKTTLIKILAGLVIPDSGTARINGIDTSLSNPKTRQLVGLVNTNARSFYWRLTGRQNLTFFASLYNLSPADRHKRVARLLDWLEVADKADIPFMKYSSGQQQRLAIGRALLGDPEILLMDEPTSSLDPIAAARLRNFVKNELAGLEGKAILWCTHDLKEAENISDRIAILHKGKIIVQENLQSIRNFMKTENRYLLKIRYPNDSVPDVLKPLTIGYTKTGDMLEVEIQTEEPDIPLLLQKLAGDGIEVFMVKTVEIPLEQVFERLTLGGNVED